MKFGGYAIVVVAILVVATVAGAVAVRLRPLDPVRWHVDLAGHAFAPAPHWVVFCPAPGTRFAPEVADPAAVLLQLDKIALSTPRTRRLAGGPEEGRITWVTRSALFGFPDLTTAQVIMGEGPPRLCIVARQAIGKFDWGVNAARLRSWTQSLLGLEEEPDLTSFTR